MAVTNIQYQSVTNITISLASLANNAARESTFIDNSSTLFLDAMVYLAIQLQTGTPSNDQAIQIWFYGSSDATNYTDNATGTNAPLTMRTPTNLRGPWTIVTPTSGGLLYKTVIPSVATIFGGIMPIRWGIVVENRTGIAFNATEGNHIKTFRGVNLTTT
jgi:hypothetical protein